MDTCCNECRKHFRKDQLLYIFWTINRKLLCTDCKNKMKYLINKSKI